MTLAPSLRDAPYWALVAAAFAMGFSMPTGRGLLALTLVLTLVETARGRLRWRMPASAWLWLTFAGLAVIVTVNGVNPDKGVPRLDKLLWFVGLPLAATLVTSWQRLRQALLALTLGLGVLALRVCVANPIAAAATEEAFKGSRRPVSFGRALIDAGTLIDGQRLMVGLVAVLAIVLSTDPRLATGLRRLWVAYQPEEGPERRCRVPLLPLLAVLMAAAEIISLKRGSWLCTLAVVVLMAWRRVPARWLLAGGAVLAAVLLAFGPARARLVGLPAELSTRQGGRLAMWTQVAPPLLAEHPWGIGFRSLTSEMMRARAPHVEPRRDHLHSNIVETAVALGWPGLALYLAWMAVVLADAWQAGGSPRPLFWMVLALLLNGLVEYNLADAEIVVIFGLLAGLAAAGRRLARQSAHA